MQSKFRRGAARKEKAVKEQLANMTIIELVTTVQSYATSIQQIDTYSAIVAELAKRLEALNIAHIGGINSLSSATSTINKLAAENAALKTPAHWLAAADIGDQAAENAALTGANDDEQLLAGMVAIMESISTTATDAFLRELRQTAWAEGINYAAGRLAAAFNQGCVNKPMAEVGDVVRMILTAKDDLANDPGPAADGLSGEYAEKALEDWEQQLRAGEAS